MSDLPEEIFLTQSSYGDSLQLSTEKDFLGQSSNKSHSKTEYSQFDVRDNVHESSMASSTKFLFEGHCVVPIQTKRRSLKKML